MTARSDIANEIREFIQEKFPASRYKSFHNDDSMLENGIIDSMGILEIVVFIEKNFGISVSDDELTPRNFDSIESLSNYLMVKKQGG